VALEKLLQSRSILKYLNGKQKSKPQKKRSTFHADPQVSG
jgi:hypothetical protein